MTLVKIIAVASTNPVKIKAARNGFKKLFPAEKFNVKPIIVPSGVSDQPFGNDETLQGAKNRVYNLLRAVPKADFWVGIEGGVEEWQTELVAFAWVFITDQIRTGKGRTGSFFLPPAITEMVRQGKELGEADDIVFNRSNSKQENGAIGILTNNVIDRVQLYEPAVIMALIPFLNQQLFPPDFKLTS
jgi:inosine/xanthosine triphosphatase